LHRLLYIIVSLIETFLTAKSVKPSCANSPEGKNAKKAKKLFRWFLCD
jgi:hypothetical protein